MNETLSKGRKTMASVKINCPTLLCAPHNALQQTTKPPSLQPAEARARSSLRPAIGRPRVQARPAALPLGLAARPRLRAPGQRTRPFGRGELGLSDETRRATK